MMIRLLIALVVLLGTAWWYLTAGGSNSQPLETQHQAIEKAEAVEEQLQQHVDSLNQALLKIEDNE